MADINWFPGHMKKTVQLISENLKMVDLVIEILDARVPLSSRNPILSDLTKDKAKIVLLNKEDLASFEESEKWIKFFTSANSQSMLIEANSTASVKSLLKKLRNIHEKKTGFKPLRIMIVGIPNVGKSTLINSLAGRKAATIGNRPGVTKGKQWINIDENIQLLDTPGVLWHKFEDQKVGLNLAICGSIKNEILDVEEVALDFIKRFHSGDIDPKFLFDRYKLDSLGNDAIETFDRIGKSRGFLRKGGYIDYERTAKALLNDFRDGRLGRITLETCDE